MLWRRDGPNLFIHLPQGLRHWNKCKTSADTGYETTLASSCDKRVTRRVRSSSGRSTTSSTGTSQRIYREEFDPLYDGDREEADNTPGLPFCQE